VTAVLYAALAVVVLSAVPRLLGGTRARLAGEGTTRLAIYVAIAAALLTFGRPPAEAHLVLWFGHPERAVVAEAAPAHPVSAAHPRYRLLLRPAGPAADARWPRTAYALAPTEAGDTLTVRVHPASSLALTAEGEALDRWSLPLLTFALATLAVCAVDAVRWSRRARRAWNAA
jgi:hypothetical protein